MSRHAKIIDIADLADPVLTPFQQGALAAAPPATLHAQAILDEARAQTGLEDFGADDFRERLGVWVEAIDADQGASRISRASLRGMCVRYAATRLRVEDAVRRQPEILGIVIDRPIIVAGLPRSGTTHMLELLSADARLRSLPWWEAIAPVPGPGDAPTADDPNPRRTRAAAGWAQYEALLPHMAVMHPFSADHISEDVELQAIDFSSYLLEWMADVPLWRDYYLSHDQRGTYRYLKRVLQVLTHFRGPNRWVIKCPQHMEQLPALAATFPDASFVITHRDPVASIQSACTMSSYAARVFRRSVDTGRDIAYWTDRYETLLRAFVRDRDVLPATRTLDVYFHRWTQDPDSVLRTIYAHADLPLTEQALAALHEAHAKGTPGHADGKIVYDLRRDFGRSPDEIRARFGFYTDRFPVAVEVK